MEYRAFAIMGDFTWFYCIFKLYFWPIENCDSNSRLVVDEDDDGNISNLYIAAWDVETVKYETPVDFCFAVDMKLNRSNGQTNPGQRLAFNRHYMYIQIIPADTRRLDNHGAMLGQRQSR